MHEIEPIERQVLQMLLAGDHQLLEELRKQLAHCVVVEREFTGVGFFTTFEVQGCIPQFEARRRIVIGDVCADVEDLDYGCGFILFVSDGIIGTLECHLWGDDVFPVKPRYNRLYYIRQSDPPTVAMTEERDMEALIAKLAK